MVEATQIKHRDPYGSSRAILLALSALYFLLALNPAQANDFSYPWRDKSRAIVIDAYEKNPIDWQKLVTNKQIVGFIGKGSDGLPPRWACRKPNVTENTLCKKTFQNYWLKKELYQTRRMVAKSLGLKWGAYHLGRPGNPIEQANHFIRFTNPGPDDLLALDIEHDDPDKWISLRDAETFVKHVKFRIGRYPILYTNHMTAKAIAARRAELPVLSRLPLWYARFKGDVRGAFPIGNWDTYALWQFSAQANCNKRRCLYRVAGAKNDIDVNVAPMSKDALREAWPFGGLLPAKPLPEYPDQLMASAKPDAVSVASIGKKPVTRFKTKLELELEEGEKLVLTSIAVPTPRNPIVLASLETGSSNKTGKVSSAVEEKVALTLADLGIKKPASGKTAASIELADLGPELTDTAMTPYVSKSVKKAPSVARKSGNEYKYTHYSSSDAGSTVHDGKYALGSN